MTAFDDDDDDGGPPAGDDDAPPEPPHPSLLIFPAVGLTAGELHDFRGQFALAAARGAPFIVDERFSVYQRVGDWWEPLVR